MNEKERYPKMVWKARTGDFERRRNVMEQSKSYSLTL